MLLSTTSSSLRLPSITGVIYIDTRWGSFPSWLGSKGEERGAAALFRTSRGVPSGTGGEEGGTGFVGELETSIGVTRALLFDGRGGVGSGGFGALFLGLLSCRVGDCCFENSARV